MLSLFLFQGDVEAYAYRRAHFSLSGLLALMYSAIWFMSYKAVWWHENEVELETRGNLFLNMSSYLYHSVLFSRLSSPYYTATSFITFCFISGNLAGSKILFPSFFLKSMIRDKHGEGNVRSEPQQSPTGRKENISNVITTEEAKLKEILKQRDNEISILCSFSCSQLGEHDVTADLLHNDLENPW